MTNRQVYEEEAGMYLDIDFFEDNGLDPDEEFVVHPQKEAAMVGQPKPGTAEMIKNVCDCCCGSGVTDNGMICSCGGTGTLTGQRDFMRKKIYELNAKLEEEQQAANPETW